jgi:TRAP-type C4-dicarboxylate transport system permease small subunit
MSTSLEAQDPAQPQRQRSALSAVLDRVATGTLAIAAFSVIGMACVEGWQVFARYVLNNSPSWTEPFALLFMTTTAMFGAALGVRANRHFGFFILMESSPPAVKRALQIFARAIAAGLGLMLSGWGGEMAIDAWDYAMPGAPLPQGMAYVPVCLGGALIALFALERLFEGEPQT